MILIDSSGWLEYFINGPLAERYASYLSKQKEIVTPTLVLYEVYKILKRELGEERAFDACAQLEKTNLISLSPKIAYEAADFSLKHHLSTADAIIYATADSLGARLITSDKDFKGLPKVLFIEQSPS